MADWTDGPEYAPTERPDVFVEPDAAPLLDEAAGEPPLSPHGTAAPSDAAAPTFTAPDAPPLDRLVPARAPERDPEEAFDVATTPMTSWSPRSLPPPAGEPVPIAPPEAVTPGQSAWGHAHAPQGLGLPPSASAAPWAPDQPFPAGPPQAPSHVPAPQQAWPPSQVNPGGFPQPGPPPWQQPGPSQEFEPVTFASMLRNATSGVLICLGLGALIHPFSLALLIVASVLAARIRYRRQIISRMLSGAIMGSFLLGMVAMMGYQGTFDPVSWYDASTGWAQFACWVLLVAVPLIVGDAMRRREPPEGAL